MTTFFFLSKSTKDQLRFRFLSATFGMIFGVLFLLGFILCSPLDFSLSAGFIWMGWCICKNREKIHPSVEKAFWPKRSHSDAKPGVCAPEKNPHLLW